MAEIPPGRLEQLEAVDPSYVDRARAAARRLAVREGGPDAARDALSEVEDQLPFDADPPAASTRPAARIIKAAVKRLIRWYFAYLAAQITALGEAVLRLGTELADRADGIDDTAAAQGRRLDELERRVAELESGTGERQQR